MSEIRPYIGYDDITFDMTLSEVKALLRQKKQRFRHDHWPNKGCDPEVPWDIIRIDNSIHIFFAKDKMWKIEFDNDFTGKLWNGIALGTTMQEALKIDPTLKYNDWEEDYASDLGYWLEDELDNRTVISIVIFIKEAEDDDVFYSYKWCE